MKQIFHKGLYKDQFKQLRLIGFISLGLLTLMSILYPVGRAISITNSYEYTTGQMVGRNNVNVIGSHFYLFFIFTVIVPILTLACFHFLTQRNSSDFYHSLPHTRTCVFACSIAAVFTWITLMVWGPTIISMLLYTILSKYFVLDIFILLRFTLFIYVASLMVASAIALACSLTGTLFTNVVVTGMILFLPRIFILAFTEMVSSASNLLVSDHLFPLLDYQYNIIFGLFGSLFSASSLTWSGLLYSSLLFILYLFLGLLLFRRRKSEAANQAAVSRRVQTVIRLFLGLTISLIPISIIFSELTNPRQLNSSDLPMLIYSVAVLYLIACLVMLLYELITTKKFNNVKKALPSIGILAILNIVVIVFATLAFRHSMKFSPDIEDIDYVVIEEEDYAGYETYYKAMEKSVEYKDHTLLELTSNTLKENIKTFENTNFYNNEGEHELVVGYHSGLTTTYRRIFMSEENYSILQNSVVNDKEYRKAYQILPELKGNKLSLVNFTLSDEAYRELYDIAKAEIKELDFLSWHFSVVTGNQNALDTILFYAPVNNEIYTGTIPITSYLPKTYHKYLELIAKNKKTDLNTILTTAKDFLANGDEQYTNYSLNCNIVNLKDNLSYSNSFNTGSYNDTTDSDTHLQVKELLEALTSTTKDYESFDPETDYVVSIQLYYDSTPTKINAQYPFIVDRTKLKTLVSYIENINK